MQIFDHASLEPQAPARIEDRMAAGWMKLNETLVLVKYIHMT